MKLGLKPVRHDPRTLKLSRYLTPALPPIPQARDWSAKVPAWLMYGNDQYGDCAMATVAEAIRTWTANDGIMQSPSEQDVVSTYLAMSPQDQGLVMLDVLNAWRHDGLLGHRIGGFAGLHLQDHHLACAAIELFGCLLLGVNLPLAVDGDHGLPEWRAPSQFHRWGRASQEWQAGSWGGHAVPAVKYDALGIYVVTWGGLKFCDWRFYDLYCMEAYAAISADWLGTDGRAPNGIDMVALTGDVGLFEPVQPGGTAA